MRYSAPNQAGRALLSVPRLRSTRPGEVPLRIHKPICLTALLLPLAGCARGILDPEGPIGFADRVILLDSVGIMLAIVIPTILLAFWFGWWFRSSNLKARYNPLFTYSGTLELIVWFIPIMVILFLGGVIWVGSHDLEPSKPIVSKSRALDIQVVSLDWKWLFIYPEQGVAAVNQLVVPAGVPLHFYITSASVMNMFFVPQLGSMIAAMNGMQTQLYLQADRQGDFYGESAQFSGDGFSDMNFTLHAVSGGDFDKWVANTQQSGPRLDEPAFDNLAKDSTAVKPYTYSAINPAIFEGVVDRILPHKNGSGAERVGSLPFCGVW